MMSMTPLSLAPNTNGSNNDTRVAFIRNTPGSLNHTGVALTRKKAEMVSCGRLDIQQTPAPRLHPINETQILARWRQLRKVKIKQHTEVHWTQSKLMSCKRGLLIVPFFCLDTTN